MPSFIAESLIKSLKQTSVKNVMWQKKKSGYITETFIFTSLAGLSLMTILALSCPFPYVRQ